MNPKARAAAVIGGAVVALAWPTIAFFEGTVLRGYKDVANVITACRGHTKTAKLTETYTVEECDELQATDMIEHDQRVMKCVSVPLTDGQHAAILSFSFNVGTNAFCRSTMARKLNAGDYAGACAELSKWVYAGNTVLPGLVKRRAAERELCEQ